MNESRHYKKELKSLLIAFRRDIDQHRWIMVDHYNYLNSKKNINQLLDRKLW